VILPSFMSKARSRFSGTRGFCMMALRRRPLRTAGAHTHSVLAYLAATSIDIVFRVCGNGVFARGVAVVVDYAVGYALCCCALRLACRRVGIGLMAYKQQLGLVAADIFLLTRAWRVIAGARVTGLGQYALACWWYRKLVVLDWLRYLKTGHYEPNEHLMRSLRPFWGMQLPSSRLAFVSHPDDSTTEHGR